MCTSHCLLERDELCCHVCHYLINTCGLFKNIVSNLNGIASTFLLQLIYSLKLTAEYWTMNGFGKKTSWPNMRYSGVWLKGLGKMIKTQASLCPDRDLNWFLAVQNSEMLPLSSLHFFLIYRPTYSCRQYIKCPHYLTCCMTARRQTVSRSANCIRRSEFNNSSSSIISISISSSNTVLVLLLSLCVLIKLSVLGHSDLWRRVIWRIDANVL